MGSSAKNQSLNSQQEFEAMVESVSKKLERRKNRPKTVGASVFERTKQDVKDMIGSGEWSHCGARHLVALYDLMHLKCYGIEPFELGPQERYNATMLAASFTKREFGGEYPEVVEYMRWAWGREIRAEKWRRENGRTDARRIGIRLMFGGYLLSDYKLFLARKSHKA